MYWRENLCHYRKYVEVGGEWSNEQQWHSFCFHIRNNKHARGRSIRPCNGAPTRTLYEHFAALVFYFSPVKIMIGTDYGEGVFELADQFYILYARKWKNWLTKILYTGFRYCVATTPCKLYIRGNSIRFSWQFTMLGYKNRATKWISWLLLSHRRIFDVTTIRVKYLCQVD